MWRALCNIQSRCNVLTEFGQSNQRGVHSQGQLNRQLRGHNRCEDQGAFQKQLISVPTQILGAWKQKINEDLRGTLPITMKWQQTHLYKCAVMVIYKRWGKKNPNWYNRHIKSFRHLHKRISLSHLLSRHKQRQRWQTPGGRGWRWRFPSCWQWHVWPQIESYAGASPVHDRTKPCIIIIIITELQY